MELDFEVDKITDSIELAATGERLATRVEPVLRVVDLTGVSKKKWRFDWRFELRQPGRQGYKLITAKEPNVIQGLVSFEKWDKEEYVFMPAIENAPHNTGGEKIYLGVCANLVAFGCKLSKEYGFNGYLSFIAKTKLISHFIESLRATHFGGQRMGMEPRNAEWLMSKYFTEKGDAL